MKHFYNPATGNLIYTLAKNFILSFRVYKLFSYFLSFSLSIKPIYVYFSFFLQR